jgi:hypothetical protein
MGKKRKEKSCQKVAKKLSKNVKKIVKKLSNLSKSLVKKDQNSETGRRRRRRRRFVAPRPGTTLSHLVKTSFPRTSDNRVTRTFEADKAINSQ